MRAFYTYCRGGGTIVGQDGMNLTGEIPIGTNPPMDTTRTEGDPDPGTGTPEQLSSTTRPQ